MLATGRFLSLYCWADLNPSGLNVGRQYGNDFFDFVLSAQWQRQPEGVDLGQSAAFEQNVLSGKKSM